MALPDMEQKPSKLPRYFIEANAPFVFPGGFAPAGVVWGVIFFVLGFGLGSPIVMGFGVFLGIILAKKVGKDEHFVKSFLQHLVTHGGVRYIASGPHAPEAKVLVRRDDGRVVPLSHWLENNREAENGNRRR